MDFLTDLMKQISIVAVMAAFLELLLPNGEMQKFIRFFMGLLILVAFLNPFIKGQWFDRETVGVELGVMLEEEQRGMSTEQILAAGQEMDHSLEQIAAEQIKEDVSLQILALVRLVNGVERVAIDISMDGIERGRINGLHITVWAAPEVTKMQRAQMQEDICRLISAFYEIPKEKITCLIEEDAANGNR